MTVILMGGSLGELIETLAGVFFFLLEDGRAWTFDSCRWWMSRLGYVICLLWLRFFRPCIRMALVGFSGARA